MNKRRLQLALSVVITVTAVTYAALANLPVYKAFADDYRERWVWKARGYDDPEVRRKDYDSCIAALGTRPRGLSPSEDLQEDDLCSRPGWIIGEPMPSRADITIAFLKSVGGIRVACLIGALIFLPWLIAFLAIRAMPVGMIRIWRWLITPDRRS